MVGSFNSSNLPVFTVRFTEHKEADKYLYQSVNVNLYNGNSSRIGYTNYIFYARLVGEDVQFTAYKRYYFDGSWSGKSNCMKYLTLDYLGGFNFDMVTSVGSEDMFAFTGPDGVTHTETMGDCSSYSDWQDMLQEAKSADLKLTTWNQDLADYFTTEYSVDM